MDNKTLDECKELQNISKELKEVENRLHKRELIFLVITKAITVGRGGAEGPDRD
jgi:hypothetical protein